MQEQAQKEGYRMKVERGRERERWKEKQKYGNKWIRKSVNRIDT